MYLGIPGLVASGKSTARDIGRAPLFYAVHKESAQKEQSAGIGEQEIAMKKLGWLLAPALLLPAGRLPPTNGRSTPPMYFFESVVVRSMSAPRIYRMATITQL